MVVAAVLFQKAPPSSENCQYVVAELSAVVYAAVTVAVSPELTVTFVGLVVIVAGT